MSERYIDINESIFAKCGDRVSEILATVADRYVGNNPPHPMAYRAFCADGILKKHDYSYDFNLTERFPGLRNGQIVYAWCKYWSDVEQPLNFILYCYGRSDPVCQRRTHLQSEYRGRAESEAQNSRDDSDA
ncbi:hypothetical protein ACHHV8_04310 [Paenibacillus sp. TAB 01]|uniref:hypothetical protein n=1 Tax=Paenibacillus sp. TAB 01 TaxID=3368988 RepID=UPI0037501350